MKKIEVVVEIDDETRRMLSNWGRAVRRDSATGLGYPRVQPMFREVRASRGYADPEDTRLGVDEDEAALVDEAVRALPETEMQAMLLLYAFERPTWAAIGRELRGGISRDAARNLCERATLAVDMWIRAKEREKNPVDKRKRFMA